jgi:hypothetical protein
MPEPYLLQRGDPRPVSASMPRASMPQVQGSNTKDLLRLISPDQPIHIVGEEGMEALISNGKGGFHVLPHAQTMSLLQRPAPNTSEGVVGPTQLHACGGEIEPHAEGGDIYPLGGQMMGPYHNPPGFDPFRTDLGQFDRAKAAMFSEPNNAGITPGNPYGTIGDRLGAEGWNPDILQNPHVNIREGIGGHRIENFLTAKEGSASSNTQGLMNLLMHAQGGDINSPDLHGEAKRYATDNFMDNPAFKSADPLSSIQPHPTQGPLNSGSTQGPNFLNRPAENTAQPDTVPYNVTAPEGISHQGTILARPGEREGPEQLKERHEAFMRGYYPEGSGPPKAITDAYPGIFFRPGAESEQPAGTAPQQPILQRPGAQQPKGMDVINGTTINRTTFSPEGRSERIINLGERPTIGDVALWKQQEEREKEGTELQKAAMGAKNRAPNELEYATAGSRVGTPQEQPGDKEKKAAIEFKTQLPQDIKDKGLDIPELVNAMGEGDLATFQATGSMGNPVKAKIEAGVRKKYPNFDFTKLDANAKWDMNPGNQRTQSMIQAALPRMDMLNKQVQSLGNTSIPIANRIKQFSKTETGSPEYTNFNSNRNAIVQEINTALSGSATSSDMRINIELENLNSARSPAQLYGAINNLNEALLSRLDSSMSPRWPKEVVQGKKTAEEYTKELVSKYRGKFSPHSEQVAGTSGRTIINQGTHNGRKVNQYSDGSIEYAD